jgi:streptogramin lyase
MAAASGVTAIDPGTGRVASLTETLTAPSNVAVGEGAVWVLNTEDRTISRIDPTTRKVVRRFEIGGVPSDIAAGAGAIWVGKGVRTGDQRHSQHLSRRPRLEPDHAHCKAA